MEGGIPVCFRYSATAFGMSIMRQRQRMLIHPTANKHWCTCQKEEWSKLYPLPEGGRLASRVDLARTIYFKNTLFPSHAPDCEY